MNRVKHSVYSAVKDFTKCAARNFVLCTARHVVHCAAFLTLFTLFSSPAFSDDTGFKFSLEPLAGIRNGTLSEYVYANSTANGKEYHLSQLDWDIKSAPYIGLGADVQIKRFHVTASARGFFKNDSGQMQDSDWLQDKYYGTGKTNIKTNFSVHDNNINFGNVFDIELKFDFKPAEKIILSPFIGFSYEHFSLTASGGKAWYGNSTDGNSSHSFYAYDDPDPTHVSVGSFSSKVIELERKDYYTWLGLECSLLSSDDRWVVSFAIAGSPFTYFDSLDSHLVRTPPIFFNDIGAAVFYAWKGSASVMFKATDSVSIKFLLSGIITGEIQGNSFTSHNKSGPYTKQGSLTGSGSKYCDVQISGVIRF